MFAVLEQAIEDLLWTNYDKRNKNQGLVFQRDAYAWFMAKENDQLFSYAIICECLDIPKWKFRDRLMEKYNANPLTNAPKGTLTYAHNK